MSSISLAGTDALKLLRLSLVLRLKVIVSGIGDAGTVTLVTPVPVMDGNTGPWVRITGVDAASSCLVETRVGGIDAPLVYMSTHS